MVGDAGIAVPEAGEPVVVGAVEDAPPGPVVVLGDVEQGVGWRQN